MIRGTSAGMYAVVLNEINLAYDGGTEAALGFVPLTVTVSQRDIGCVSSDLLFAVLWACTVLAGAGGQPGGFWCARRYLCSGERNL